MVYCWKGYTWSQRENSENTYLFLDGFRIKA